MWLFFVVLLMYGGFLSLLIWGSINDSAGLPEEYRLAFLLLIICIVLLIWLVSYGFRMWRGLRHPRWGHPRWDARTNATFRMLGDGSVPKPISPYARSGFSPMTIMPMAWIGSSWSDQPLFYDIIPGLLPLVRHLDPRRNEGQPKRSITFEARFYPDRVEKGSTEHPQTYLYGEIFDIVEDKRFPSLAIIRMKDEVSEIVIHKDSFEGISWEGVKDYIKQKNGWVTLREAVFGERRKR